LHAPKNKLHLTQCQLSVAKNELEGAKSHLYAPKNEVVVPKNDVAGAKSHLSAPKSDVEVADRTDTYKFFISMLLFLL
jgi:hypothetical protein